MIEVQHDTGKTLVGKCPNFSAAGTGCIMIVYDVKARPKVIICLKARAKLATLISLYVCQSGYYSSSGDGLGLLTNEKS